VQRPVVEHAALPGHARARGAPEGAALPDGDGCGGDGRSGVRFVWQHSGLDRGFITIWGPLLDSAAGARGSQPAEGGRVAVDAAELSGCDDRLRVAFGLCTACTVRTVGGAAVWCWL